MATEPPARWSPLHPQRLKTVSFGPSPKIAPESKSHEGSLVTLSSHGVKRFSPCQRQHSPARSQPGSAVSSGDCLLRGDPTENCASKPLLI